MPASVILLDLCCDGELAVAPEFLITGIVFGMSGQRNNTIAIASLVIGGAAVVAGGVMHFLGSKQSKERASIAVVPRASGAELAVGWKF